MKQILRIVAIMATSGGLLLAQGPRTPEVLFKAAQHKAQVEGDLKGAIEQFRKIADGADRAMAAKALIAMAQCYLMLGNDESRAIYERVVREFADQKEAAAEARTRLAALHSPAAAQASQAARQVWIGAGANYSANGSVSPDGRYFSVTDSTGDLTIRDLRDGTSRRLTHNAEGKGYAISSVISPDGQAVAYNWGTHTKDFKTDLRILPASGEPAQPRIVYQNEETTIIRPFAWSPDGRQLLVLCTLKDRTNQIAMVLVQDGSVRVLKSLAWQYATLRLSPDGRYIAYDAPAGDTTSARDIFVLATDGSRETKAVENPADDSFPLWSPDGSRILFLSNRTANISLWSVPIEGGGPKGPAELVKADLGRIRPLGMTRSGALYYLVSGLLRTNVYIAEMNAALKATKKPALAAERFINSNGQPSWSPDGQYLAYYYSARGPRADGSGSTVLVIRTLKTGEERDLSMRVRVGTGNFAPSPKWFPDGRSVLVAGSPESQGRGAGYYRVDLASGNAELLHVIKSAGEAAGLGSNAVSPDGKTIVYIDRDGNNEPPTGRKLLRFDIESRRETVLKSGHMFTSLAISPDGTEVAFVRYDPSTQESSLEVMPAGGGETRQVFRATPWSDSSRFNTLAWSPDQRHLLFVRRGAGEDVPNVLWRVPAAGGEPEQIGISMTGQLMYPDVHPDGGRMAFGLFEFGASEVWALENFLAKARAAR